MSMKILSLSQVRANLPKLVEEVDRKFGRVTLTRSGKAKAVLMSSDEFEGWQETIEILNDTATLKAIRRGESDRRSGRTVPAADVSWD